MRVASEKPKLVKIVKLLIFSIQADDMWDIWSFLMLDINFSLTNALHFQLQTIKLFRSQKFELLQITQSFQVLIYDIQSDRKFLKAFNFSTFPSEYLYKQFTIFNIVKRPIMYEPTISDICSELDAKITEISTVKSLMTRHIKASVTVYDELKQYTHEQLHAYIRTELEMYQQEFQMCLHKIVEVLMAHVNSLDKEKRAYEKQAWELKEEVSRQYKVIGLMKQEVEDLMVLVNSQRSHYPVTEHEDQKCKEDNKQSEEESKTTDARRSLPSYQSGLEVIEEEETERTVLSSQPSQIIDDECVMEPSSHFEEKEHEMLSSEGADHSVEEEELSSRKPRLLTDPNPHLQSILISEQNTYKDVCFRKHNLSQLAQDRYFQPYDQQAIEYSQPSSNYLQEQDLNQPQKQAKAYQPKTKQFLQQFRRTFNKCLQNIHTTKKHSTKINNRHMSKKAQENHYPNKQTPTNKKVSMMLKCFEESNRFNAGSKKLEVKYEGEKRGNVRHGNGVLYYSNGLLYEGEFRNGLRCGYGILKFNHIEIYNGDWVEDEMEGQGKIRNCAIINKKKSMGKSSSILNKWISYTGELKGSRLEGEGTLYLQGGQKFVGRFMGGNAEGEGTIYRKNGEVESGIWKNNILIQQL